MEQTVKKLQGQDTQQIILQKNDGLPNLFDKKLKQKVTVQYIGEENEKSDNDVDVSFKTAKLDQSEIVFQPQKKIIDDDVEVQSQNSLKNAPKEDAESIFMNSDTSFARNIDQTKQTYHSEFIYSKDGKDEFQSPCLSKFDKQNNFLSQLPMIQMVIKNQEQFQNRQLDVKKQMDNQQTKIFLKIKEFSIGNYKYENINDKYQKKYIPMFPHLYLKNNINKNEPGKFNEFTKYNLDFVDCFFYNKFQSKKQNQNDQNNQNQEDEQVNESRKFPSHIQLKFTVDNKDFKKGSREHKVLIDQIIQEKCEEEQRSQPDKEKVDFEQLKSQKYEFYQGQELKNLERQIKSKRRDFQLNVKLLNSRLNVNYAPKIFYQYEDNIEGNLGNFDMVIEQMVPGEFMEGKLEGGKNNKWYNSLSPLQYDNDLINYWNLKQVIFIRGQKHPFFDPEIYLKNLVEQELIQGFESQIPKEYNFNHVNTTYQEGSQNEEIINRENYQSLKKDLNEIKQLGEEFNQKINQLAMPLRLSVMVLISNQRVQVFDRNIVDLIDYLIKKKKFTYENQQALQIQQSEQYWNNDFPQRFEYKQYQIAIEQLFFKTGVLQIEKPLEQGLLIKIVDDYIDTINKEEKSPLSFLIKEQTKNPNKLAQRRIWMTPTVKIIRPMELDQSNPLLRQLKYVIEYFVRINIMNDNFQDFFFNNEMQNNLLQQFVQPIIKEINLCGIKYKFLNYSASQIKQKSWWQLIDNHGFHLQQEESEATDMSKQISLIKNRETLLNFMGKFNDPKQLKQLARQGQSMSSSIFICNIDIQNIRLIDDIKNKDYAFTDGCGYVSQEVMDKVCEIFDFFKASAIQMRYSGFKGVLMVHPNLGKISSENSQKIDVLFSAGMKKFEGHMKQLSVIRCATFSPGFLNRQVILILSHLGVKDEVFIQKNNEAIERLDIKKALGKLYKIARKIREMEQNNVKMTFKQMQEEMSVFFGPSKQFKPIFIRAILLCNKYTESVKVNVNNEIIQKRRAFELDQEPIFEQILLNMVLSQAQILKKKQRIRIKDSAVLIGVCDIHNQITLKSNECQEPIKQEIINELNGEKYSHLLQENEVFCQIEPLSFQKSTQQEKKLLRKGMKNSLKADGENAKFIDKEVVGGADAAVQLIKGPVLITKNPCGHEGDIRLAHAIDESHPAYEKLKHLVNVIVFPLNGSRPLQNQMSGGDLDGDVYMIIWDKEIVEQATKNKIPPPCQDDKNVLENHTEDVGEGGFDYSETICKYFKRDLLGFLSNLHLKLALQTSLNDDETVLAGLLCQVQVDFAKHGRCVKIDIIEDLKRKVKGVPKFLADEKEQYEKLDVVDCSHVIQKLYDQVDLKNMFTDCLKKEHEFSILQKYTFSKFVIDINSEGKISEFLDLKYADYLTNLYLTFVYPMECELKQKLLIRYKILNEGELFCSDFKYRFSDDKQNDYIGALGKSDEDLVRDISQELDDIIKKYRKLFDDYSNRRASAEYPKYVLEQQQKQREQEEEKNSQINSEKKKTNILKDEQYLETIKIFLAKCLYFASYFHLQNEASYLFLQKMKQFVQNSQDPNHKKGFRNLCVFAKEKSLNESKWIADCCQEFNLSQARVLEERYQNQNEDDSNMDSMLIDLQQYDERNLQIMRDELKNFKTYKQICKKAECDNLDKINLLWSFKKILSVPWLIAYDYILV